MSFLLYLLLFLFGLGIGSFINVLTIRYQPEKSLISRDIISGRSFCPSCGKKLKWYELIPLFSFIIQNGRCRGCSKKISWQYPIVEFITGLLFVLIFQRLFHIFDPFHLVLFGKSLTPFYFAVIVWLIAAAVYLIISIIDLKHQIIPDGLNLFLVLLSLILIISGFKQSFLGPPGEVFGFNNINTWLNHFIAGFSAFLFFALIFFIWRGKGIGLGDLKLAAASGFLLGLPDIFLALILAFFLGAIVSIFLMICKKKTLKTAIPFGPFLALGVFFVFFFGESIIHLYFNILGALG